MFSLISIIVKHLSIIIFVFFIPFCIFGQSKQDSKNGIFKSSNGIVFKVGDTLEFNYIDGYSAIYQGRGLSIKQVTRSLSNTKCVINKFKNMYGYHYTYCKDLDNQTFTLMLDSAIKLDEIKLSDEQESKIESFLNPPRDIPEDYIPFNFQGVTWKSSKQDVLNLFPNIEDLGEGFLQEKNHTTISGINTDLSFLFYDGKLGVIMYYLMVKHTNENKYIEDYLKIKKLLIEKYGEPTKDRKNWRSSLYKDDYERYGFAVTIGDLEYITFWSLPDTDIILQLSGDNYKISHNLAYLKYPRDKKSINKKESLKKL